MPDTVALLGNLRTERQTLDMSAAEFGWSIENAGSLGDLRQISANHNIIAVLFESRAQSTSNYPPLQAIREAVPGALPIVCHRPSEPIFWPQLAEAGAFHALLVPFHPSEVRQSLAFVHEAARRRLPKVFSSPRAAA